MISGFFYIILGLDELGAFNKTCLDIFSVDDLAILILFEISCLFCVSFLLKLFFSLKVRSVFVLFLEEKSGFLLASVFE